MRHDFISYHQYHKASSNSTSSYVGLLRSVIEFPPGVHTGCVEMVIFPVFRPCLAPHINLKTVPMINANSRAGGSARVAKVLAFASFGLQILESDMSCNVFTS